MFHHHQQTSNHLPRLDCPSVSAETNIIIPKPVNPKPYYPPPPKKKKKKEKAKTLHPAWEEYMLDEMSLGAFRDGRLDRRFAGFVGFRFGFQDQGLGSLGVSGLGA